MLSSGIFGLRNRIFGKFFGFFYLATFGNTSDLDEILGNSMISDMNFDKAHSDNFFFITSSSLESSTYIPMYLYNTVKKRH